MCCMFVWLVRPICFGLENIEKHVFCLNKKCSIYVCFILFWFVLMYCFGLVEKSRVFFHMQNNGWLVERLTAVAVVHRHNLHQQISGSAPETSLLPSPPASGGLLEQEQEQERKDSKQKKTPNNPKKEPLTSKISNGD